MKVFSFLLTVIIDVFFTSADPHLFGSRKRRKAKEKLAKKFDKMAGETEAEIEALKIQDPFESAAAKSAMKDASRKLKQQSTRFANIMGARGATPEAMIAAQQATQEGIGEAAGQIAVGAEAQKQAEINALRNLRAGQQAQYGQIQTSAISERGSGWNTLFQGIGAVGQLASGAGQAAKAFL